MAEAAAVGVPEPIARGLVGPDLLCVTIEVAERLDDELGRRGSVAVSGDVALDVDPRLPARRAAVAAGDLRAGRDAASQLHLAGAVPGLRAGRHLAAVVQPGARAPRRAPAVPGDRRPTRHRRGVPARPALPAHAHRGRGVRRDARHLDAIATDTGLGPAYRLRGVDVHRVLRCTRVPRRPRRAAGRGGGRTAGGARAVRPPAGRGDRPGEVRRQALDALDDLFGFRFAVLFVPEAVTGRLLAIAASR